MTLQATFKNIFSKGPAMTYGDREDVTNTKHFVTPNKLAAKLEEELINNKPNYGTVFENHPEYLKSEVLELLINSDYEYVLEVLGNVLVNPKQIMRLVHEGTKNYNVDLAVAANKYTPFKILEMYSDMYMNDKRIIETINQNPNYIGKLIEGGVDVSNELLEKSFLQSPDILTKVDVEPEEIKKIFYKYAKLGNEDVCAAAIKNNSISSEFIKTLWSSQEFYSENKKVMIASISNKNTDIDFCWSIAKSRLESIEKEYENNSSFYLILVGEIVKINKINQTTIDDMLRYFSGKNSKITDIIKFRIKELSGVFLDQRIQKSFSAIMGI